MTERRKYTPGLRKKILKRDNHTSQFQKYSEEKGWHTGGYCKDEGATCNNLHIHHISPQRVGKPGVHENENLITVFECEHIGRCKDNKIVPEKAHHKGRKGRWVGGNEVVIHRDMQAGLMNYDPSRNAFQQVFADRDEAVLNDEEYWNSDYDKGMSSTAEDRSKNPKWWNK